MLRAYPPPYFWIAHIDGSARPNPGRMSAGVVLMAPDGRIWERSLVLPGTGCNNEAELGALVAALEMASHKGAQSLRIYTDSRWLIEQLDASTQVQYRATARLHVLLAQATYELALFQEVQWRWVPRHHNTQADALAASAC